MSSLASLTAVIDSMKITGTAVVNQGREETCGIICQRKTHTNSFKTLKYLAFVGLNQIFWKLNEVKFLLWIFCRNIRFFQLSVSQNIQDYGDFHHSTRKRNVYLKDHEQEEVGVGEPSELLKEVKWEEGEDVVFGGLDGIVLKQRRVTDVWGQLRCFRLTLWNMMYSEEHDSSHLSDFISILTA